MKIKNTQLTALLLLVSGLLLSGLVPISRSTFIQKTAMNHKLGCVVPTICEGCFAPIDGGFARSGTAHGDS